MIDLTGEPGRIDATKVDDLLEEPLTMLEG